MRHTEEVRRKDDDAGLIDVIWTSPAPICRGVSPAGVGTSASFERRFS